MPPHDALWTAGEIGAEFDFLLIIKLQPTALAVLMHAPKFPGSLIWSKIKINGFLFRLRKLSKLNTDKLTSSNSHTTPWCFDVSHSNVNLSTEISSVYKLESIAFWYSNNKFLLVASFLK